MSTAAAPATAPPAARPALVADSWYLALRHLRLMSRRPSSFVGAIVFPIMFAVLFMTVFGAIMDRGGLDYPQYMLPAVVLQSVLFAAMSGSIWAAEDAGGSMVSRLRAMPISRAAPIISLLLGEAIRALIGATVLIVVGFIMGFRFQTGILGVLGFYGLVTLASLAFILPYLVLGFAVVDPEKVQVFGGIVFYPLLLVSILFVPGDVYPSWLRGFAENQPLSCVAEALRAVTTDGSVDTASTVGIAVAWMIGLLAFFGLLAPRVFGRVG